MSKHRSIGDKDKKDRKDDEQDEQRRKDEAEGRDRLYDEDEEKAEADAGPSKGEIEVFDRLTDAMFAVLDKDPERDTSTGLSLAVDRGLEQLYMARVGVDPADLEKLSPKERLELLNSALRHFQPTLALALRPGFARGKQVYDKLAEKVSKLRLGIKSAKASKSSKGGKLKKKKKKPGRGGGEGEADEIEMPGEGAEGDAGDEGAADADAAQGEHSGDEGAADADAAQGERSGDEGTTGAGDRDEGSGHDDAGDFGPDD